MSHIGCQIFALKCQQTLLLSNITSLSDATVSFVWCGPNEEYVEPNHVINQVKIRVIASLSVSGVRNLSDFIRIISII